MATSNVGIAKSVYFPTLGANAGIYQEYNTNKDYDGSSNRDLPSAGITMSQLIWNFGKASSLIKMEQFYKLAAEYQFMDSICNTIYDVKTKYFSVLKAKSVVEIEKNNLLICENNLIRVKKLFESKKRPKIDLVNAEYFVSDAKIRLTEAQNDYSIALANLGNSLYVAYAPDFQIKETKTFRFSDTYSPENQHPHQKPDLNNINKNNIVDVALKTKIEKNTTVDITNLPFTMEESFGLAYKNSPDLWVLEAVHNAMQQSVYYIKRQYYPDLVGNVGYGYNNSRYYSNNNMRMYVNLNSTVNIKQLKHEIDRAQSQVNMAINDIDLFKQDLYFEVKKYFLTTEKDARQIPAAKIKVEQAFENYELALAKYEAGTNDYIALQNARENYNLAKLLYVEKIYNYNISRSNLEIAMHYHLDDIHQQAEHALHYHYKELINKLEAALHCGHDHDETGHKD